ncbi:hypothetical protein BSNK01_12040 [Bacillaceae bacterium]
MRTCPKCGHTLKAVNVIDGPFQELAEYIYNGMIAEGYVPNMREINLILSLQHEFVAKFILKDWAERG